MKGINSTGLITAEQLLRFQATKSSAIVDIGSVDLSQVITLQLVFSPAPLGEECWLYFISDYHQVTDMPLLLTRMFGHMMTAYCILYIC